MPSIAGKMRLKVSLIMLLIFLSFWLIAVPVLIKNNQKYHSSEQSYQRLELLHIFSELCLLLSEERGPATIVMSKFEDINAKTQLMVVRSKLDFKLEELMKELENQNQLDLVHNLKQEFHPKLLQARQKIDAFAALDASQKNKHDMEQSIIAMFVAWDEAYRILQQFLYQHQGDNNKEAIDLFNLTLIFTEFRDQAGRVGANFAASLVFQEELSDVTVERILTNQKNMHFLWSIVSTLDNKYSQDEQYRTLEDEVQKVYITENVQYLNQVLGKMSHGKLNKELNLGDTTSKLELDDYGKIQNFIQSLNRISQLQDYIAQLSKQNIEKNKNEAFKEFVLTLVLTLFASVIILLMLYILNYKIFFPLFLIRDKLLKVLNVQKNLDVEKNLNSKHEINALFQLIQKIQEMIENREQLEQQLTFLANTDGLTGLYNRAALNKKIEYLEKSSNKFNDYSLLVIDIDNFKIINDQYGHLIGDQVIINISKYLKEIVRADDFAVRYGGDELIVLLKFNEKDVVLDIAYRLKEKIAENPLDVEEKKIAISVSVGVATGAESWVQLMHHADLALLHAKKMGKNTVQHYDLNL